MGSIHFLNGKLVSEEELLISPRDLGYSRGYGVFEFLTTYRHKPFLLRRHIDRLFFSAESISLSLPWSKQQVFDWVMKLIDANSSIADEKAIRISLSGGDSFTLAASGAPTVIITVDPNVSCPPEHYKQGVAVKLTEFRRYQPKAKTNNYIEAIRVFEKLEEQNIDELIYHSDNMVREGTRCNVFAVIGGKLLTPKTGVLEGITRELLLEILKLQMPVVPEDFSVNKLLTASEVFITATGKGVMPVTVIEGAPVGDGKVGPITQDVMKQYAAFIQSDLW